MSPELRCRISPRAGASAASAESYPFWGYLDLLGFVLIALLGFGSGILADGCGHRRPRMSSRSMYWCRRRFCSMASCWARLALIFRRYYGRPFWHSLRWVRSAFSTALVATCGVMAAFVTVMAASVFMRTPDIDSPMKALLSDPHVRADDRDNRHHAGADLRGDRIPRISAAAAGSLAGCGARHSAGGRWPSALMHLQEYGYSWRHALLISAAGAAFGWMRQRTGSTKAAALMHAAYNGVFFLLLADAAVCRCMRGSALRRYHSHRATTGSTFKARREGR